MVRSSVLFLDLKTVRDTKDTLPRAKKILYRFSRKQQVDPGQTVTEFNVNGDVQKKLRKGMDKYTNLRKMYVFIIFRN